MFGNAIRRTPGPFRTFVVALGVALFACLSVTGVGTASTDPVIDIPGSTIPNYPGLSERCQKAVDVFNKQIEWILAFVEANPDFDPDDPELSQHRDRMWRAWEIAEFECGIDVGGDGEIG